MQKDTVVQRARRLANSTVTCYLTWQIRPQRCSVERLISLMSSLRDANMSLALSTARARSRNSKRVAVEKQARVPEGWPTLRLSKKSRGINCCFCASKSTCTSAMGTHARTHLKNPCPSFSTACQPFPARVETVCALFAAGEQVFRIASGTGGSIDHFCPVQPAESGRTRVVGFRFSGSTRQDTTTPQGTTTGLDGQGNRVQFYRPLLRLRWLPRVAALQGKTQSGLACAICPSDLLSCSTLHRSELPDSREGGVRRQRLWLNCRVGCRGASMPSTREPGQTENLRRLSLQM
ncbi:hypothetical protein B0T24DRAFT_144362 [Lasiosphaeria ovina]|uniref:Uncharacterized protein n=1 Tax=Lasiosphaeria ovina TaxID=92902 RepID=A0AAE0KMU2_9PEZI|nr:hypothetical protein B0T24DRAFT_144362 [Lasiosphaeria ovina]